MIVAVPAATPVTTPVLLTEAMDAFDDTHGLAPAAVTDPVNVVVNPTQTLKVPLIVGTVFTVINAVLEQPLLFV